MNKFIFLIKRAFLIMMVSVSLAGGSLFAQNVSTQQGKIIIMVLDVSGSIRPYFNDIRDVLQSTIVEKRLEVGDYFVLIPFGDEALPMYSGQLLRKEDTASIKNSLQAMKADNNWTDIGTALTEALTQIRSLKSQNFDLYEPLVLFITDGDITTSETSRFRGQSVDELFQDDLIGETVLYNGWYFIGIGDNLHDLPRIAELSGRSDYIISIGDLANLESILDEWISNIPPSKPLERGLIEIEDLKIGSKIIGESRVTLPSETSKMEFALISTYERTPVSMEILSGSALFQSTDRTIVKEFPLACEAGRIEIMPQGLYETDASINGGFGVEASGTLKITLKARINGEDKDINRDVSLELVPQSKLVMRKVLPIIIAVVAIIIVIVIIMIAKSMAPVRIYLEVSGKKSKIVKMKIGQKRDFGSRSTELKLDGCPNIVGTICRTSKSSWKIEKRSMDSFDPDDKALNGDYKMGTPFKVKKTNGDYINVKFRIKK